MTSDHSATPPQLQRVVRLPGAILLGLGSILGTGVFVSLSLGAGVAGSYVLPAIFLAGLLAICNGFSSAQLAASHPVSGGTYEYGYQYLTPTLGFSAGWMFLCAKSASAATAALGASSYLLTWLGASSEWLLPVAELFVVVLTLIILWGMRRTSLVNSVIVSVTLASLVVFVVLGLRAGAASSKPPIEPLFSEPFSWPALLQATALMFVAYTGYGRIATLGEEVAEPRRTIPKAILATLAVTMLLYLSVAAVAVMTTGGTAFGKLARSNVPPLQQVMRGYGSDFGVLLISCGAITAMTGVLLNLILGLSRVALAMGRRNDLPAVFAQLKGNQSTPLPAVLLVAVIIGGLALLGDFQKTWSLSAFTVLLYYSLTNLAALQLPPEHRLYPRWISWCGLLGCLTFSAWVDFQAWVTGLCVLLAGLLWRWMFHKLRQRASANGNNNE